MMVCINMTGLVAFLVIAVTIQTAAGQTTFDWGRPCTLVTSSSSSEIDPSCQDCGSGSSADAAKACNFKDITVPASEPISFYYHSSTHNLFVGSSRCAYTTEICPSASAETISKSSPCSYTPGTPGTYYISDKTNDYCNTFKASLKITAT